MAKQVIPKLVTSLSREEYDAVVSTNSMSNHRPEGSKTFNVKEFYSELNPELLVAVLLWNPRGLFAFASGQLNNENSTFIPADSQFRPNPPQWSLGTRIGWYGLKKADFPEYLYVTGNQDKYTSKTQSPVSPDKKIEDTWPRNHVCTFYWVNPHLNEEGHDRLLSVLDELKKFDNVDDTWTMIKGYFIFIFFL